MHQRIEVRRDDLTRTRAVPDPDAPEHRPLADGQARLRVRRFALTANNVTYAAFGEAMKYWQFFPAGDAAHGVVPVWGFADVVESRADGVAVGEHLYGYLPMGSHLVVTPAKVGRGGFSDGAAHREGLAAIYNRYERCAADPAYRTEREGLQAVLRPLFTTSFLIDDFLADRDFFGARQVLLSSASSKTAWGLAFCLARRPPAERPRIVGLTSARHVDTVRGLGCYDEVIAYDALETLDAAQPAVYVDMAGDAALRRRIHGHWGERLGHSASVGGTHWQELGGARGLPGPRPTLFFAPARAAERAAPPPDGWGTDGLMRQIGEAWSALMARVDDPARPWLTIVEEEGSAAIEAAWRAAVAGRADPREGRMLRP